MEQSKEITILKPVLILSVSLEGIFPKSLVLLLWFPSETSDIALVVIFIEVRTINYSIIKDYLYIRD